MAHKSFTIGICCSGNTCRSPITAIWLEQLMTQENLGSKVKVWTAGIRVLPEDIGQKMYNVPIELAQEMGINNDLLDKLKNHTSKHIDNLKEKADLLVWITDPEKISTKDSDLEGSLTRFQEMEIRANKLNSTLLVIPERDEPWEARKNGKLSENEVRKLYRNQALKLKEWSSILVNFVK